MLTDTGKRIVHMLVGGGAQSSYTGSIPAKTIGGTSCNLSLSSSSSSSFFGSWCQYNFRMCFGTNSELTPDMYTLENLYGENSLADNKRMQRSGSYRATYLNGITTQGFVVTNTGTEPITYTCFGSLVPSGRASSQSAAETLAETVLVAAWMLKEPVTIPAGESKTIQVEIDVNDV